MSIGLISPSPKNVFRERGYQDGLDGRKSRFEKVRADYGREVGMAYAVGFRRGKERREGTAA